MSKALGDVKRGASVLMLAVHNFAAVPVCMRRDHKHICSCGVPSYLVIVSCFSQKEGFVLGFFFNVCFVLSDSQTAILHSFFFPPLIVATSLWQGVLLSQHLAVTPL